MNDSTISCKIVQVYTEHQRSRVICLDLVVMEFQSVITGILGQTTIHKYMYNKCLASGLLPRAIAGASLLCHILEQQSDEIRPIISVNQHNHHPCPTPPVHLAAAMAAAD